MDDLMGSKTSFACFGSHDLIDCIYNNKLS